MAAAQKLTKKRPAATQAGPSQKKIHLDQSSKTKKRSQPITKPVQEDSDDSDLEEVEEGDVDREVEEAVADDDDPMEGTDGRPVIPKDPNAARESHKAQKILQDQRRAAKPHSTLLTDAKRIWSLARQKNIPTAERQKHIQDLMAIMRGKVKDVVLKHDASRIVQTVVKHGGQKERDEIAIELKGKYKELAQNKYSKFLVTKLIRFCPSHRSDILHEFHGHVLRLLLHREASAVLGDAFELHANAYERSILVRDFYGKETALFSLTKGSTEDKERAKKGLSGVLEGVDKERRKRVLTALKEGLVTIFNNPDKGAVAHPIVHRALWEYLSAVNEIEDKAEREKLRREMFETCQDVLAEIVHTKDGSRVTRELIAQGSAKDRKQIIKVLKDHVARMCSDDEAQLVLFTVIDVTDDTKLILKSIVPEMTSSVSTLYSTPQGRRSIIYLLVPRTRRHFTPAQIVTISETDEIRSRTSKKAAEVREGEIRAGASEALIQWVKEKGDTAMRDPGGSLLLAEIMLFAEGDKSSATGTLLKALATPYPSDDAATPHPIDLPHTSRMYKALLQGGHFNHNTKAVERAPESRWDAGAFAERFVEEVGEDVLVGMCTKGERNGAFVVAELCEALKDAKKLKGWFGKSVLKEIESGEGKGKKVLLDKINAL